MTTLHKLCRVADLPANGARGFSLPGAGTGSELFVVCRAGSVHAYLNRCPHTAVTPGPRKPGAFLDAAGELTQCSTHGALFRGKDGYCIYGPCAGRSLSASAIGNRDGMLAALLPGPRRRRTGPSKHLIIGKKRAPRGHQGRAA